VYQVRRVSRPIQKVIGPLICSISRLGPKPVPVLLLPIRDNILVINPHSILLIIAWVRVIAVNVYQFVIYHNNLILTIMVAVIFQNTLHVESAADRLINPILSNHILEQENLVSQLRYTLHAYGEALLEFGDLGPVFPVPCFGFLEEFLTIWKFDVLSVSREVCGQDDVDAVAFVRIDACQSPSDRP
jgi:hypothetical protein